MPTVPSISRYTRRLSSASPPCQKQIERNYCTTNMACIEELDHKDCIGLHSTNPPHTQCHRNRWLNKDCWISQSDRRLGNSCLFFCVCHLEDKNLVRPRSGLYQAGQHQFIQNFSSCSCRHVWANLWLIDDGMFRVWMSFRGRRDENQVNKHCCQSAERVHTTTLSFQTESLVDVPACLLLLV